MLYELTSRDMAYALDMTLREFHRERRKAGVTGLKRVGRWFFSESDLATMFAYLGVGRVDVGDN